MLNAQFDDLWFLFYTLNFWHFVFFRSPFACFVVAVIGIFICLLFDQTTMTYSMIIYYHSVVWIFQYWFKYLDQIPLIDVILRFSRTFNFNFNGLWIVIVTPFGYLFLLVAQFILATALFRFKQNIKEHLNSQLSIVNSMRLGNMKH